MSEEAMGHVCPPKLIKFLNSPLRKLIQNPEKILGNYVRNGDTVVDIGCGGGFFTVELAKMVGPTGRVIAVDLQPEMLEFTRAFAARKGTLDRVTLHQCKVDSLSLSDIGADVVLAFYVVHEVPDRSAMLRQIAEIMKPEARFVLIEPAFHVTAAQYGQIVEEARHAGLEQMEPVRLAISRGAVFKRIR